MKTILTFFLLFLCGSIGFAQSGCTDSSACNYNSLATEDDGSCEYPGCIDPNACNFQWDAACHDQSLCITTDCMDPNACNYNPGCIFMNFNWCVYPTCDDPAACNYDPNATCVDNTLCFYPGCTDGDACNYDPNAGCDDGSCIPSGCMDKLACNFNPNAQCEDWCNYNYCTNVWFLDFIVEECDSTHITINFQNITPSWGTFFVLVNGEEYLSLSIDEIGQHTLLFTEWGNYTVEYAIKISPLQSNFEVISSETFTVFENNLNPPLLIMGLNGALGCGNCPSDYFYHWYFNGIAYWEIDQSTILIPDSLGSGEVILCAGIFSPPFCTTCSDPYFYTANSVSENRNPPELLVLGNGSPEPVIVSRKQGILLRVFDTSGRIILSERLWGQNLTLSGLSPGVYYAVTETETLRVLVIE